MGIGGISAWELLLILAIVMLIFGTKRLKNLGSDLGTAFRGFKNAMSDKDPVEPAAAPKPLITAEDSQPPPATDTAERKTESSKEA